MIGIIGGGQLARMTALEARRMGYRIAVLDPDPEGPAARKMGHVLILDEDGQDGAKFAEAIAADLERAVAAGPGERAWT